MRWSPSLTSHRQAASMSALTPISSVAGTCRNRPQTRPAPSFALHPRQSQSNEPQEYLATNIRAPLDRLDFAD